MQKLKHPVLGSELKPSISGNFFMVFVKLWFRQILGKRTQFSEAFCDQIRNLEWWNVVGPCCPTLGRLNLYQVKLKSICRVELQSLILWVGKRYMRISILVYYFILLNHYSIKHPKILISKYITRYLDNGKFVRCCIYINVPNVLNAKRLIWLTLVKKILIQFYRKD